MKCVYCNKKISTNEKAVDHFFPKFIFSNYYKLPKTMQKISSLIKNNKITVCGKCNLKKSGFLFWSIESVQDFIKSNLGYTKWLLTQFKDRKLVKLFKILPQVIKIQRVENKNLRLNQKGV